MILDELAEYARYRVSENKKSISENDLKQLAYSKPKGDFSFEKALRREGGAIISEVKKASPSKGIISEDFPYLSVAKEYESAGTDAISCLTEPKWFLGSDDIFREIRKAVSVPMLRKDFTVDRYQIYEAKVMGADAVLLICAILNEKELLEYLAQCDSLGLSALVETHSHSEIETAVRCGARIIGVNNRDLRDFSVNTSTALNLRSSIPDNAVFVAESGVQTPQDGAALINGGANAVLIGEALMRSADKKKFITELRENAAKN